MRKARAKRLFREVERRVSGDFDDPALEWLIGFELRKTFEKFFEMKATVLGPSGEASTPFIAFVLAVAQEGDIRQANDRPLTVALISDIGRANGIPEDE